MSADDIVMEGPQEVALQTDESVLLSMDNIVMEGAAPEYPEPGDSDDQDLNTDNGSAELVLYPIPEKISGMLETISAQNPAGEDPRYGDEFVLIKTEIDKLAFNDYSAVMTLCEEILKSQAKDMRVAGYYLLANTYINRLNGLADGLMLYRLLLEKFADGIYPRKESAQIIALQWLNNSKLLAYTKQHQNKATYELVMRIGHEVEQLNKAIISLTNEETVCLTSIYNWVKETGKKIKPPEVEKRVVSKYEDTNLSDSDDLEGEPSTTNLNVSDISSASATNLSQTSSPSLNLNIDKSGNLSDTELYSLMRKIVSQLNAVKDFMRGVAYARAARWGGMIMPPSENAKTRLTPPRQSGINEIKRLQAQEDYEGALRKSEGIFFEMGGHMLLDLQHYAHKSAKGMGKNELANFIAYETAALLKRLPGLEDLRFDDETPFASPETIGWLNSINGKKDGSTSFISSSEEDASLVEAINVACEVANDQDLNTALTLLDEYRPRSEKQRFQLRLALAQLCLDHGRPELAYPMLEDLLEQAKSTSLAMWDCGLAISVAKQLQNAIRGLLSTATEQNRTQYEQKLAEVTAQMCRWDLALAAQIL